MSKVTPEQYRAARKSTVTCPSGLTVKLKKRNIAELLDKFVLTPETIDQIKDLHAQGRSVEDITAEVMKAQMNDLFGATCCLIALCAVEPVMTMEDTEDPGALCARDLDPEDAEALAEVVCGFYGLKRGDMATLAPFPHEADAARAGAEVEHPPVATA